MPKKTIVKVRMPIQVKQQDKPLDLTVKAAPGRTVPQLRVWWIPQVPGKPFEVLLSSFAQAKVLLESLAQYDLFQLAHNIKPDFSNAGGVQIFEAGDWADYDGSDFRYSDDVGTGIPDEDFDGLTLQQCIELDNFIGSR
jgi:hypothetical protein